MTPLCSIVMTTYQRAPLLAKTLESIYAQRPPFDFEVIVVEDGDDGGETRSVVEWWPVIYLRRWLRPKMAYANQGPVLQNGIRRARGEVLILQNAECMHHGNVIEELVEPATLHLGLAQFVSCRAYEQGVTPGSDSGYIWYCHGEHRPRPLFFCGAIRREHVEAVGGYPTCYPHYGSEDTEFADLLAERGLDFCWRDDIMVSHQWHPPSHTLVPDAWKQSQQLYLLRRFLRTGA